MTEILQAGTKAIQSFEIFLVLEVDWHYTFLFFSVISCNFSLLEVML